MYAILVVLISLSTVACRTHSPTQTPVQGSQSQRFVFRATPELAPGVRLGGFSGLTFEGRDPQGRLIFQTTTDRGPNRELKTLSDGKKVRPFVIPSFQPEWVRFYLAEDQTAVILERRPLAGPGGKKLSGRPNYLGENGDETPVDDSGNPLELDPMGMDLEGLARDTDGTYWMGEEYRPSILHFDGKGSLLSRWIPNGNSLKYGLPVLPDHFRHRIPNRGFEGIADDGQAVFAFFQGALKGDDSSLSRVVKVSKKTGLPIAEYIYAFEKAPAGWPPVDKIGDAVAIAPGRFLVIEQNSAVDEHAFRRVYEVQVNSADNLRRSAAKPLDSASVCVAHGPGQCFTPLQKRLIVDLAAAGLRHLEKAEGITIVDPTTIAVINDDDFGVGGQGETRSEVHLIRLDKPLKNP